MCECRLTGLLCRLARQAQRTHLQQCLVEVLHEVQRPAPGLVRAGHRELHHLVLHAVANANALGVSLGEAPAIHQLVGEVAGGDQPVLGANEHGVVEQRVGLPGLQAQLQPQEQPVHPLARAGLLDVVRVGGDGLHKEVVADLFVSLGVGDGGEEGARLRRGRAGGLRAAVQVGPHVRRLVRRGLLPELLVVRVLNGHLSEGVWAALHLLNRRRAVALEGQHPEVVHGDVVVEALARLLDHPHRGGGQDELQLSRHGQVGGGLGVPVVHLSGPQVLQHGAHQVTGGRAVEHAVLDLAAHLAIAEDHNGHGLVVPAVVPGRHVAVPQQLRALLAAHWGAVVQAHRQNGALQCLQRSLVAIRQKLLPRREVPVTVVRGEDADVEVVFRPGLRDHGLQLRRQVRRGESPAIGVQHAEGVVLVLADDHNVVVQVGVVQVELVLIRGGDAAVVEEVLPHRHTLRHLPALRGLRAVQQPLPEVQDPRQHPRPGQGLDPQLLHSHIRGPHGQPGVLRKQEVVVHIHGVGASPLKVHDVVPPLLQPAGVAPLRGVLLQALVQCLAHPPGCTEALHDGLGALQLLRRRQGLRGLQEQVQGLVQVSNRKPAQLGLVGVEVLGLQALLQVRVQGIIPGHNALDLALIPARHSFWLRSENRDREEKGEEWQPANTEKMIT
eukprot:RCo015857